MITEKEISSSRNEFLDLALNLYGIKLDGYRPEFIDRRLGVLASKNGFNSMFQLKHELVNNELFAKTLEMSIAVNVTEMFRDPIFFKVLKNIINTNFKTSNELKIWHPACSKGHEVFSLAILLKEIGMLENSILYGTDICHESINEARKGVIRGKELKKYSTNYLLSGGKNSLSEYFKISYDNALLSHSIKERIKFSYHKLGTDSSFQIFLMILC